MLFRSIAAIDNMLKKVGSKTGGSSSKIRPTPVKRTVHYVPSIASLYGQVELRQENAYLSIGERCNANGSKQWRTLQEKGDWEGCVAMGREQVREGSNALDICTAFVGRDEVAEMDEVVRRMRGSVNAPLVIDSTEYPVLESSLALYGGKAIINSINFEDGEEPAARRLKLAKKFGAAVVGRHRESGHAEPDESLPEGRVVAGRPFHHRAHPRRRALGVEEAADRVLQENLVLRESEVHGVPAPLTSSRPRPPRRAAARARARR